MENVRAVLKLMIVMLVSIAAQAATAPLFGGDATPCDFTTLNVTTEDVTSGSTLGLKSSGEIDISVPAGADSCTLSWTTDRTVTLGDGLYAADLTMNISSYQLFEDPLPTDSQMGGVGFDRQLLLIETGYQHNEGAGCGTYWCYQGTWVDDTNGWDPDAIAAGTYTMRQFVMFALGMAPGDTSLSGIFDFAETDTITLLEPTPGDTDTPEPGTFALAGVAALAVISQRKLRPRCR